MTEAQILDKIFRAYDIRGVYPDEINEDVVFKIAAGVVKFLNPDKLVIGQDTKKSSLALKESVITAITASGVDVIDIGMATTPLFYFAVNHLGAGGGIMITASHNPPNYNGLKIVRERAIVIGENNGLLQIRSLFENLVLDKIRKGKIIHQNLEEEYRNYLFKKSGLSVQIGLSKEPEIENVRFEFDPDSDRLIVSEKNKKIRPDLVSGVIIKDFLDKKSFLSFFIRPKFVYDLRFTKAIPEFIKENGGEAIISRVGHPFIKEAMRNSKALFGAELSGHFYFKDVFYVEAPILMKLKLLKILEETGESLAELTEPFKKYFHSGEVNITIRDDKQATSTIEKLKEVYRDGKINELDGITIEYWDPSTPLGAGWWFNLRPSNTEPVLRLVVEAQAQYTLDQKVEELTRIIQNN